MGKLRKIGRELWVWIAFVLWGPLFVCVAFALGNPGFWDGVPWGLYLGFALAGGAGWLGLRWRGLGEWLVSRPPRWGWGVVGLALAGHLLVWGGGYGYRTRNMGEQAPHLVVLGLDAANWSLIDPLIEQGRLPTLKKFRERGVTGSLRSMDPMWSPALWTTMAAGVSPEVHGISGFFATQQELKRPRVWEYGLAEGMKIGLFAWMVTWPPDDRYAFCIPSWFAPSPETRPEAMGWVQAFSLEQGLAGQPVRPLAVIGGAWRAGVGFQGVRQLAAFYRQERGLTEEEHLIQKMGVEARVHTDAFLALLRTTRPEVAAFVLYGVDKLGHRFWHDMQPERFAGYTPEAGRDYRDVIPAYYEAADRELGRIIEILPEETTVVLLSDHGMKADDAMPRQFFLDIPVFLRALGWEGRVRYQTIMRHIALEPRAADELAALREAVEAVRFEGEEEPLFQVEEEEGRLLLRTAFSLTWHGESPLVSHAALVVGEKPVPVESLFFVRTFSGAHDPMGIVGLVGPGIRRGESIQGAGLLDIAPTLLYLMGLPVRQDMEGEVLVKAFTEEYLERNPIRREEGMPELVTPQAQEGGDSPALMERLRTLGYIR